jgi:hypothetical protein
MQNVIAKVFGWLLCACLASFLAGCASTPHAPLVLDRVGPIHPGGSGTAGQLMVLTATERIESGRIPYDIHTSYSVLDASGKVVQSVVNHVGQTDQSPMVATLPIGKYTVVGRSEAYGLVRVPVLIQGHKMTYVYLERGGIPKVDLVSETNVVRFPNGDAIGWRAP